MVISGDLKDVIENENNFMKNKINNQLNIILKIAKIAVLLSIVLCVCPETAMAQKGVLSPPVTLDRILDRNLSYNKTGDDVLFMQEYLRRFYPEVSATGRFDIKTREAVKSFQEKYKKEVLSPWKLTKGTGYVGTTTREKFNEIFIEENIQPRYVFSEIIVKTEFAKTESQIKRRIKCRACGRTELSAHDK